MSKKTEGEHYILDDQLERIRDNIMSAEYLLNAYINKRDQHVDDDIESAWRNVYAANKMLHTVSSDLHYALSPLGSYVLACDDKGHIVMRCNKAFDVDTQEFYTVPHDPTITDLVPETRDTETQQ